MKSSPNHQQHLIDPTAYRNALEKVFDGLYELITLGGPNNIENLCCYELTNRYDHPEEFLRSLMDMMQVMYDRNILGTLLLNSNPSFMLEAIPQRPFPFRFGYFSLTSLPAETPTEFLERAVLPMLDERYPDWRSSYSSLLTISNSFEHLSMQCFEFSELMNVGLRVDDAVNIIKAEVKDEPFPDNGMHVFGTTCDDALGDRTRLSGWFYW